MKLKYEKPSLLIEKYEMCQNIAIGCSPNGDSQYDYHANWQSEKECGWYDPTEGMYAWANTNTKCGWDPSEDATDMCYNGPYSGIVAFSS